MSRYQKGKTDLDFSEARDYEWQWHQLGHICKSAPRYRQISTPAPHRSVFTGQMPFLPPSQQCHSTEGKWVELYNSHKYIGVYINSKTNSTDPVMALRKLFGSFNNIMSVLGSAKDEMLAVHLVKTYCWPVLLYDSETWSLSSSDKYKLNFARNNCFHRILMV